ncbi:hypothetical protein V6N11_081903 [Hibiscus sabdariffa]|uniref:Uncharacterized protein n=1 Tax=Hibiscus sabdariffa TaxID=183260 RepID=A0ABR2Q7I5_9ROSI
MHLQSHHSSGQSFSSNQVLLVIRIPILDSNKFGLVADFVKLVTLSGSLIMTREANVSSSPSEMVSSVSLMPVQQILKHDVVKLTETTYIPSL